VRSGVNRKRMEECVDGVSPIKTISVEMDAQTRSDREMMVGVPNETYSGAQLLAGERNDNFELGFSAKMRRKRRSRSGGRCRTTSTAIGRSDGNNASSFEIASRPPAEAPIATISSCRDLGALIGLTL
jgi:hypothetical protein